MHALTRRVRGRVAAVALAGAVGTAGACAPSVTTQQEVQLGADYSRQINRQLPLVRDAAANQYINALGTRVARAADPRGIPYTFYIVNSAQVNAFAIPGGHIYINRGLIERSANESQLAGVLAHEVGHVVERHGIEQMQRANNANTALSVVYGVLLGRNPGTLEQVGIQAGGTAVFASYGRNAEREADAVAIGYMMRAGFNPQGIVGMFQILLSERQSNPSRVAQWFSTHPLTEERVANTQAAIRATAGANATNLVTDSREFQNFKNRVRTLTPQPQDRR